MTLPSLWLSSSLVALQTHALPSSHFKARSIGDIQWGLPCVVDTEGLPIDCGNLVVPLDYTNESDVRTVNLELLKLKSTQQPFRGSILTHWGGPGPSGREDFVAFAPRISAFAGGFFDLILPVQRGSMTSANLEFICWNSSQPFGPTAPELQSSLASSSQGAKNWANAEIWARDCFAAQNETGRFLGSATDARDWMSVVDALGEDGMLRYYGVSAGTTLGNHLVSMFPDRVDKVILDGVVNPHEYVTNSEIQVFTDTDKVFSAFCSGCVAAPENCTLGVNKTADVLEGEIKGFIDGLIEDPIVVTVPGEVGGYLLDFQWTKQYIYRELYTPATWPNLSIALQVAMSRDDTLISTGLASPTVFNLGQDFPITQEAQNGIKCSDQDRFANRSDWEAVQSARHNLSYFADHADPVLVCARWKLDAKERYSGNFSVKTANPVLLIGNTADPITPIAGARNASAGYEGSVVLEHGWYGHCSHLSQASLCTAKAIRSYFLDGVLPEPGTKCEVDVPLFAGTSGWDGIVAELGPA